MLYRTKLVNETLTALAQTITGRASVEGIDSDGAVTIVFEANDLWEASQLLGDLKDELVDATTLTSDFEFEKPVAANLPVAA